MIYNEKINKEQRNNEHKKTNEMCRNGMKRDLKKSGQLSAMKRTVAS